MECLLVLTLLSWNWCPSRLSTRITVPLFSPQPPTPTSPIYLQTLVRAHTPAQAICSTTSAGQLVPPLRRENKGHSAKLHHFSVLVPQWWSELTTNVRTGACHALYMLTISTLNHGTSMVLCCGFCLVTNVFIVMCFRQKHLLNA